MTRDFRGHEGTATAQQASPSACRHALSTDCDLSKAPRRRTDGAIVLDTDFYVAKLYTQDGEAKLIKRESGNVERQFRVYMGKLPIGYRSGLLPFRQTKRDVCLTGGFCKIDTFLDAEVATCFLALLRGGSC